MGKLCSSKFDIESKRSENSLAGKLHLQGIQFRCDEMATLRLGMRENVRLVGNKCESIAHTPVGK